MPPTTETRTAIGQNSYLSFGLVLALLAGAVGTGQVLERLRSLEKKVEEISVDVKRLQTSPATGR